VREAIECGLFLVFLGQFSNLIKEAFQYQYYLVIYRFSLAIPLIKAVVRAPQAPQL
jgi:hypothetical protein